MDLKLGKLAPRFDPKTPLLKDFLKPVHLATPVRQDWPKAGKVAYWGVSLNDQLGDCVIASKLNSIILFTTLAGAHKTVALTDDVALSGYEAVGGYVPGDPSTDNGCDMLTAAQYFKSHGFSGHKIDAFATVHHDHLPMVRASMNLFGVCDIGFQVPRYAMDQFYAGKIWDVSHTNTEIDGGHDVPLVGFDAKDKTFTCVTWGRLQHMTERFFLKYCDEALTYLSPDWIDPHGLCPSKFNLAQLRSDLLEVAK